MENKKLILFLTTFIVPVFFIIFSTSATVLSDNNNTFSFQFENCTVTDALKEISEKSGINIISNGTLKKDILIKSFRNRTLDTIISNLLRGENCAVVWNYSDGNLYSIDIYTFDENDVKTTSRGFSTINRTNRDNDRNVFQGSTRVNQINETRDNYLKNRGRNGSRSNTPLSSSRTYAPVKKSTPKRVDEKSNNSSGASTYAVNRNTVSNTSHVSANMRRAAINKQNGETKEEVAINPQPSPESQEPPEPEKGNGLERPPMPPGL